MFACRNIRNFAPFSGMRGSESSSFFNCSQLHMACGDMKNKMKKADNTPQTKCMIDKNIVKEIVETWLEDKEYFLVDIEISADDRIVVEIDHADGVWIEDCVALSRYIEEHLSRDEEDYELEVGSAGLGQPFKVPQQYVCFVGKDVEVLDADGKKYKGLLKSVDGNNFTVTTQEKVKVEGKKRPQLMDVDHTFDMNKVKYTKYLISFK